MRCKRCGSLLNIEDHLCRGCGKALIDLRKDNEIIYSDEAVKPEELKKEEAIVVEEKKESLDIFGDAVFKEKEEKKEPVLEAPIIEPVSSIIEPVLEPNIESKVTESVNALPLDKTITIPVPLEKTEDVLKSMNTFKVEGIDITEKDNYFKKKNKSKAGIIFAVIAIIMLIIGGGFVYIYSITSPRKIFDKAIENLKLSSLSLINSSKVTKVDSYFSVNTNATDNLSTVLNNLKLNTTVYNNYDKKESHVRLNLEYEEDSVVDANMYIEENELYIYLTNIFDKYIKMPLDINSLSMGISDYDLYTDNSSKTKNIISKLSDYLKESLSSKYLSRKIEKIDINNKSTYVIVSTIDLSGNKFASYFTTYLDKIKNDSSLIEDIASLNGTTSDDIKSVLDTAKEDLKDTSVENFKINLYSNFSFNLVKMSINIKEDSEFNLNISKANDKKYLIELVTDDENTNIEFSISENNGYTEYHVQIAGSTTVSYNLGIKTTYNEEISFPSFENFVDISELTDEDYTSIYENFLSDEKISEIVNKAIGYNPENIDCDTGDDTTNCIEE